MAISSDTIIIIAVCASLAIVVLAISSRFLLKLRAKKSSPLPPKQPLAHHRATYYQPSTAGGYYGGGASKTSLASKERFPSETTTAFTGHYFADDVQSLPSSIAHPPLQSEGSAKLGLPTPSFYPGATNSDPSLVSRPSSSDGGYAPSTGGGTDNGIVPFPPDIPPDFNPFYTSSAQSSTVPSFAAASQGPRPRPLSHVSTTSSHHTTRSRTSRSVSSHAHGRRSGLPHDPSTGGIQIVLPAPLAPSYTGSSGPVPPPPLPRGAAMPENRLSFVDAWAPNAGRERELSTSSTGRLHRPRSSLHISYSPSSSTPSSPFPPPSPHIPNTPPPRSREPSSSSSSSRQPPPRQRPSTAPHHHQSRQNSTATPSPMSSRAPTPSALPHVDGSEAVPRRVDEERASEIVSPAPQQLALTPVRSETFHSYNLDGCDDRPPPPIPPKLESGVAVVVSS